MIPDPRAGGTAALFTFDHPALRLESAFFTLQLGTREPIMRVRLGQTDGTVPLRQVMATFDIKPDSPDGLMLRRVEAALRYVPTIRHGDTIPTEIVDGTASWSIDPKHKEMAALRIAGTLFRTIGRTDLAALEGDGDEVAEAARRHVKDVAADIARRSGLPEDDRMAVVERVEALIGEFAYIEALRSYWKPLFDMPRKLREIVKLNQRDRDFTGQMATAQNLLKAPTQQTSKRLEEADRLVEDPFKAIRDHAKVLKRLRQLRDVLHGESLRWGDIPATWGGLRTTTDAAGSEALRLSRFLSTNFYNVKSWAGGG